MAGSELLEADAGALDSAGIEFLACGNNVQDVMTRLRNQSSNLTATFQGSAAQVFYGKVDTICQQIQTLVDEINKMGNDLKITAAEVRDLQAKAASMFNSV